jgi:hypothetical protein
MIKNFDDLKRRDKERLDARIRFYWTEKMFEEYREQITAMLEDLGLQSVTINIDGTLTGTKLTWYGPDGPREEGFHHA